MLDLKIALFPGLVPPTRIADGFALVDHGRMKRVGLITYGVAIVAVAMLTARDTLAPLDYVYREQPRLMAPIGLAGWILSTFGPLALSLGVWMLAPRVRARWRLHLMFVPVSIIVFIGGAAIFYRASGTRFGVHMMYDFTLLTAVGLLLVALAAHCVALAAEAVKLLRPTIHNPSESG